MSYRQAKRIYRRHREEADRGLVHRWRGPPSNRDSDHGKREQALTLYRERHCDLGAKLATEYLAREHQLLLGVETPRRWPR